MSVGDAAVRALGPSPSLEDQLELERELQLIEDRAYESVGIDPEDPDYERSPPVVVVPQPGASTVEVAHILWANRDRLHKRLDEVHARAEWARGINQKNYEWMSGEPSPGHEQQARESPRVSESKRRWRFWK
jgi:hypothetical protein